VSRPCAKPNTCCGDVHTQARGVYLVPLRIKAEIDTRRLNRILRNLPGLAEQNNRAIAFRIEGIAKSKSPVDTGANRASIYVVTKKHDGYAKARAESAQRRPGAISEPLPSPNGTDAHVGPAMEYSMALEFGSRGRAGRPYLLPAVREVERHLAAQWGNIADE
jgi:hypothetical protein